MHTCSIAITELPAVAVVFKEPGRFDEDYSQSHTLYKAVADQIFIHRSLTVVLYLSDCSTVVV